MTTNTAHISGPGLSSSTVTLDYTPQKRFNIIGPGLGKSSGTAKLSLSQVEIMQVICLYNAGVFHEMIENNTRTKDVEVASPDAAPAFFTTPVDPPGRNRYTSTSSSEDSDEPPSASGKNRLYNEYVKIIKAQNPDLTHRQALTFASNGYKEWKASQS